MQRMSGEITDNRGRGEASWKWPSVHPEGRKFALIAAAASLGAALLAWETVAWPLALLVVGILAFFRDPLRVTPRGDDLVISPADGLITLIQKTAPPAELAADMAGAEGLGDGLVTRVSIFMSVFDVHINRAPIAGTVRRVIYIPGKFLNADLDKASEENERRALIIEKPDGVEIAVVQIAGLIARRIVAYRPMSTLSRMTLSTIVA